MKLTTNQFIEKARTIHGNKYDYSQSVYVNSSTKLSVICKIHGTFFVTPNNHLQCVDCPKCGKLIRCVKQRWTTEEFIALARQRHSDRYEYGNCCYVTAKSKVAITCKAHGNFMQKPFDHLNGSGCSKCKTLINQTARRKTLPQFIIDCEKVHGKRYDYSNVHYTNSRAKVEVVCYKHGPFWVKPESHTNTKSGCPKCLSSHGENDIRLCLQNMNLVFKEQKMFDQCTNPKSRRMLKFDFYVPKYNLLIEFDGRQHYESITLRGMKSGSKTRLADIKYRDNIKNQYAARNNIPLLRIPYFCENVLSTISEMLQSCQPIT